MTRHYAGEYAKWEKIAPAVGRVALPYSLGQLSDWLARGGMAAGAVPTCERVACAVAPPEQAHGLHACGL